VVATAAYTGADVEAVPTLHGRQTGALARAPPSAKSGKSGGVPERLLSQKHSGIGSISSGYQCANTGAGGEAVCAAGKLVHPRQRVARVVGVLKDRPSSNMRESKARK
jgi:hypothetical protein